ALKPGLYRDHGLAVELDEMRLRQAEPLPAAQMREQPRRYRNRRRTLVRDLLATLPAVQNAAGEVDVGAADRRDRRRRRDHGRPRAAVDAEQDEPRDMAQRALF